MLQCCMLIFVGANSSSADGRLESPRVIEQKASVSMVTAAGGKTVESSALAALAVFLSMTKQAAANPAERDTDFGGKLVQYKVVETTFAISSTPLLMMMAVIFVMGLVGGWALTRRGPAAKKINDETQHRAVAEVLWIAPISGERFHTLEGCGGLRLATRVKRYTPCVYCCGGLGDPPQGEKIGSTSTSKVA